MEDSDDKAMDDYKQKFLDVTNDMIQLNKQLDGLKKEKEELKKNLENLKAESDKEKASLNKKIADLEKENNTLTERVSDLEKENANMLKDIGEFENENINLKKTISELEKENASMPVKIEKIKPPIPEKVEEIEDNSISESDEKRRTCPKCGNQNLRQIREIVDKTKIISDYPKMYGKKYICGECGTEWG
ncbi:MAG: hypothetical protein ACFFAH_14285 [Promethearchaeota archaeon]